MANQEDPDRAFQQLHWEETVSVMCNDGPSRRSRERFSLALLGGKQVHLGEIIFHQKDPERTSQELYWYSTMVECRSTKKFHRELLKSYIGSEACPLWWNGVTPRRSIESFANVVLGGKYARHVMMVHHEDPERTFQEMHWEGSKSIVVE